MSRKAAQFANVITNPLNIHNFECFIPGIDTEKTMIISSTTFPTEKFRTITLWFQGEPIVYPTLPETDHSWKFKIPEDDSGIISQTFDAIKSSMYNQKTGIMLPKSFDDVYIRARDLAGNVVFEVILHGAWLQGKDPVALQNSNPADNWNWDYMWQYSWIEDKTNNLTPGVNPMGA